jgi:lipoprotein NlpI/transglutaminase-like putative cysteine protease
VIRLLAAGLFALIAGHVAAQTPPVAQTDREIQVAADALVKDATIPSWVVPHALPEGNADGIAAIRLFDHQILVGERNVVYVRNAIRINNTAGLTPLGRVPIAFIPAYQKVVLHTLQLIRDGTVLDRLPGAQVRFLQREAGLENYVYSGVVTASILIDDLRVGDTIELAYSLIGTNPVFGKRFGAVENWDQQLPVAYRRVIVSAPTQRPIHWKFHGDLSKDFPKPVEQTKDGLRSLTFEQSNIPRVTAEALTPPGFSAFRWLQLSEYDDWQDVATWASTLFDVTEAPNAERAKLVATLMAKPTVEERIVGALEFVQSQVRYFSVSLGTSSHQPTAPNTVIERRYGDCKDKSLLLVTLLKDMGIASTPVLARLGNRSGFDDWLPTPLAFDHVIVAVDLDGTRYWLDSTRQGQHGRLATMGQAHDGAQVLPAERVGGRLVRVAVADRDRLNLNEVDESLTVDKLDGDGTFTVAQTLHGVAAEVVRASNGVVTKERVDESLVNDMQKRYPNAELVDSLKVDDDPIDNRVTLTTRFTLRKPLEHSGGQYRFLFRATNFARLFALPSDAVRHAPVALRFPVDVVYRFTARLPEEVAVVDDEGTIPIDDRYFAATSQRALVANRVDITMKLKTLSDRIAPTDLQMLKNDVRKLDATYPSAIVIRDADIKKSTLLGLLRNDFATTLKARQEDLVAKTSTAIDSGRLTGGDLARAQCARANALASLDRADDALKDADRAVELDPNAPFALLCRAQVRLTARRFAASVDDASQAIVLGEESAVPWQLRGEARFYLGRYAEAADDFAKAATLDRDEHRNANHDLWRAMAYRRLKKPLPDDLQKRAAGSRDEPWPRPALALFADRLKPEELSAIAAGKRGDEGVMVGTEADFYLGEFYLATDDRAKARAAFEAARARGVIVYTEYGAAAIELDRLAAPAR